MNDFFSLYYGFRTWVVCHPDGALESAHEEQFSAMLRVDLINWVETL